MYRIPMYKVTLVRDRSQRAEQPVISAPNDAYEIFNTILGDADREQFVILLLDTRNRVRGMHIVSIGSLNASIVHPREVFKAAILANCSGIILGHGHPSGDPTPSSEDITTTTRLIQAGELLGIPVLDHLVLGDQGFISMKVSGVFKEH
ncbi:MAG TPA: DNA repair protein RadC [Armatimonadota bacterium]|jgi:DNA repair protein RadC